MSNEKVSIIMPVYNGAKTIKKAINSVLKQTYNNIQLIIINNGSTDSTEEIIKSIESKNKIIYIYTDIPNVSNARNIGIDKADGEYITFIDADDEYESNFIERMINRIKEDQSQIVSCNFKTLYSKEVKNIKKYKDIERTTDIKKYIEIVKEAYLFNELWNKIYLTQIVKDNKIYFNTDYELGEDMIFNIDYIKYVKKASFLNEPLYKYTDGQDGLNLKYRENKFQIEYELTQYLKNFYMEKEYDLKYIYNRFARVYYNGILNICSRKNKNSNNEKSNKLNEFVNSKQYKEDMKILKNKVTDTKFRILITIFLANGIHTVKLFIYIYNLIKKE